MVVKNVDIYELHESTGNMDECLIRCLVCFMISSGTNLECYNLNMTFCLHCVGF